MDDDDHHNNHDHNKNMKRLSSEEGDPEAQNSKLAQEFEETSDGAGGDNENGGNDEQLCGRAVGATGGDNSIPVTEGIDARASSAPQTLEVPVEHGLQLFESAQELKDQVASSKEEKPKSIADQTAPAQTQNLEETPNGTLSSELSPTSVTQFVSSLPSPAQTEQKLSPAEKRNISDVQTQEVDKKNSFDRKNLSVISVQKTPSPDGYNWRKYGQKQVKSPQGSRSYYRCTHADCYAKKIECSDDSNRVTEIVYKSHHSHDPPQKVNCTRGSRVASSVAPVNEIDSSVRPIRIIADSVPSTSSMDSVHEMGAIPDPKQKESSQPHDISENVVKQEHVDETEPRKRLKKTGSSHSESPSKAGKKPKFVVQAAGDVGISGDGYRWRKYGQKMVKGNPHPRNYYRCTSAGCPVRKHIERAKDNTNAAIITYKGVHDHDKPVPKKRQGPPSTPLVAAASPASINSNPVVKPENIQNQESATQWSADKEGGLKGPTLDCGAEKAVESTRTLLSIGFEIKPC